MGENIDLDNTNFLDESMNIPYANDDSQLVMTIDL